MGRQHKIPGCPRKPPDLGRREDDVGKSWVGKTCGIMPRSPAGNGEQYDSPALKHMWFKPKHSWKVTHCGNELLNKPDEWYLPCNANTLEAEAGGLGGRG